MANDLQFHSASNIFPLMTGDDFDALVKDIQENGLREEIDLLDGQVIDGRNRYRACIVAGVKSATRDVVVHDPIAYVLSMNLHRRHLTPSQLSMIAGRVKDEYAKAAKERMSAGGGDKKSEAAKAKSGGNNCSYPIDKGRATEQAGKAVGISGGSVKRAATVLAKGIPELAKAVDEGKIAVAPAAKIAMLPKSEQPKRLADAIAGKPSKAKTNGKKEKEELPEGEFQGVGVIRANEAIDCLKRIPKNDRLRKRGFQIVTDWIRHNR